MAPLEPIPVPLRLRWREFKIRLLPVLVFFAVLCVAVFVWRNRIGPQGVIGQVELNQSVIGAGDPVTVVRVLVRPHQTVKAGDPLVIVAPANPRLLEATADAIRAEAVALQQSLETIRPQQQMLLDFERMRIDSLDFQAQLAVARVEAALAESELVRAKALAESRIVSAEELERLRMIRDARRIEVVELTGIVAASEKTLEESRHVRETITPDSLRQAVSAMLDLHEKKIRLIEAELGQMTLTSPRDGVVGLVHYQEGSLVLGGMPILSVVSPTPENVVAFIRQPFRAAVEPGTAVELRARSGNRQSVRSVVHSVGTHLEPVNALLYPAGLVDARNPELGLAVRIPVPPEFRVHPGETVEVIVGP